MSNSQKMYILPLLIFISGICLICLVDYKIEKAELEKRAVRLQTESNVAITQFLKGINKLAILTSGIRSYIESKSKLPAKEELQSYLKTQFEHLATKDSLVVSFIDSNHIFRYSVTPNSLTPNNLDGSSVKKIRDSSAIARLDKLLTYPEFRLFPPINMVEGYVGIPLNFRVVKDSVVVGYIASLINFKSVIDDLYLNSVDTDEFVYQFLTVKGDAFDRVAYYDGSKIYNSDVDLQSFKRSDVKEGSYTYSSFNTFGYQYQIGVAFRAPYERSWILIMGLIAWLGLLVLGVAFLINFLKGKIKGKEELLSLIENELTKKNDTLASFKYISSHDLKEPLRGLVSFSMILKRKYGAELDEDAKDYLDYITNSASQMNNVLDDLVKFTSLAESSNGVKKKIDLGRLIKNIQINMAGTLKSVQLIFQIFMRTQVG